MADDPSRLYVFDEGTLSASGFGIKTIYINRCWHYSNEEFVRWSTEDNPDPTGVNYPGPGTFGVATTSPAVVESII